MAIIAAGLGRHPRRRPRRLKKLGLALVLAGLVSALVASSMARAATTTQQRSSCASYCPELMDNWQVFGPLKKQAGAYKFVIELNYPGGESAWYKQLGKKDVIPAMWTQLGLPTGMKLLNSGSYKSHFSYSNFWWSFHKPVPKSSLKWQSIKGVPTWKAQLVSEGDTPRVVFWVTGSPGQCFTATTQGMYRYKKHWRPIPRAPKQTASPVCLPGSSGGTTTTTG